MKSRVDYAFLLLLLVTSLPAAPGPEVPVGAARIDITPELPIRLAGYQSRATEATTVESRLYARALAIGGDAEKPVVILTVEVIGVAEAFSDAVAAELARSHGIERARVAVCATHVHTGPSIAGVLPFMFSEDLPADQAGRIERYTEELRGKLVQVARAALDGRRPGRLGWGEGRASFNGQRRVIVDGKWTGFGHDPNGVVDRALPVLGAHDGSGTVRALLLNYACHCTTLTGRQNFVHHDWAGDAALRIEAEHEGAVALVAIGCGADANPNPRGALENVAAHGQAIAAEVRRVLGGSWRALGPVSEASYRRLELPLERVARADLERRAAPGQKQVAAYAARKFLQALDAGRPLPTAVPLPVQTWSFGGELAMVFLGGEVVADYALRLRRELDGRRLWVTAYANSVPCYVASKRMYPEGGYEVDGSMDYYGWPARLALGTEDRIIAAVRELLPAAFEAPR